VNTAQATQGGHGWVAPGISPVLYFLVAVTAMSAGTVFLMWLGELVDEYGIGNGISLIIMAGIVDRLPAVVQYVWQNATMEFSSFQASPKIGVEMILLILIMFVGVVLGVVLITQAQRRIPIQQAKHTRGRRTYGGQRQYLPLRVNQAGVIPVIFASSLLYLPMYVCGIIATNCSGTWARSLTQEIANAFGYGNEIHQLIYVALIFVFCYFWTAIQFQPREMANNLRDWGTFIPGMRPGRRTAEYLERVMNRITYVGSAFLAVIAIVPMTVSTVTHVPMLMAGFLGGTSLLIIVSVALDVVQRIESHLIMRHYEGFLAEGRVRGRRG
jgi:preprotein translocase subunit SecY